MSLVIKYVKPACADGVYRINAKNCVFGILFWGDENGVLPDWTAIAYVPLQDGSGSFRFAGGRAVPPEATRVYARLVDAGGNAAGEVCTEIPPEQKTAMREPGTRFVCLSDIHFTAKTGKLTHVLSPARDADALLLTGDLVNDGKSEQFRLFDSCLRQSVNVPVFPVCGNHDLPLQPEDAAFTYADLEQAVFARNEAYGVTTVQPREGIYIVPFRNVEIIGVACVSENRKFKFPAGVMDELEAHFSRPSAAQRHILLCHAPLLAHNPKRNDRQPYLNLNHRLQALMDNNKNVIFLSGHLHTSPCGAKGSVEITPENGTIYISNGSVCPNTAKWEEPMIPEGWTGGTYTLLRLSEKQTEICFCTLFGKKIARGYYVFDETDKNDES